MPARFVVGAVGLADGEHMYQSCPGERLLIGSESQSLCVRNGSTLADRRPGFLALEPPFRIIKIEGGVNLVSDTKTWPKQARLLADGKIKEFEEYVKVLVNSRDPDSKS